MEYSYLQGLAYELLQFNFRKVCLYSFAYAQKGMSPLSRTPTDLGNDLRGTSQSHCCMAFRATKRRKRLPCLPIALRKHSTISLPCTTSIVKSITRMHAPVAILDTGVLNYISSLLSFERKEWVDIVVSSISWLIDGSVTLLPFWVLNNVEQTDFAKVEL